MSSIQIRIDEKEVIKRLKKLDGIKNGGAKASLRALNKTVAGMKADASKAITDRYHIKKKDFYNKLAIEKATSADPSIVLRSQGRPIRLIKFKTRKNRRPGKAGTKTVFANTKKSGTGGYTGGFMATMTGTNGIHGVFVRTGHYDIVRRGKYKGMYREGIRQLYGPGTVQMLKERKTSNIIKEKAVRRFYKELDGQVDCLL